MAKPTFYTAFSNSLENNIPNLSEEAAKISDLLQELVFEDKLYYLKDEFFDYNRLASNFVKYGRLIDIFYFSGHGVDGCLQLQEKVMEVDAMTDIVNTSLKNAKLLFFNACETFHLARKIIDARTNGKEKIALISCRTKVNTFQAERFATLFFSQVGQPGTYREAYDQAKSLCKAIYPKLGFKEFVSKEDLVNAGEDFDIAYIEIGPEAVSAPAAAAEMKPPTAKSSIIGKDKLTRDALTSNYVHEVVESLVNNQDALDKDKLSLLKEALVAAKQIAGGQKKDKEATQLFNKAAEALPGISSGSAFESLINAEKNIDNPSVKNLIKTKKTGTTISSLVDQVSELKL